MVIPLVLAALTFGVATPVEVGAVEPETGVPAERVAKLARGVNLSHWYWSPVNGAKGFANTAWFTKDDAAALKTLGITHVRLPIDPAQFFTNKLGGRLHPSNIKKLDATLDMLKDAGLAVVVDLHALGTTVEAEYEKKLKDPTQKYTQDREKAFVKDWETLAEHLSSRSPDSLFLELLNEPIFDEDAKRWEAIQLKLANAVRAKAPSHTLILTGNDWGSIHGLKLITPIADKNVIYTFHFYEPYTFTHQSATWGSANWKFLKDIPYPCDAEIIKAVLPGIKDDSARGEAKWYGGQNWNAAKIEDRVKAAAEWSKANATVVWCGEFGVYRGAPEKYRTAWLADFRAALDKNKIGWCMWDWGGTFGMINGEPGKREIDAGTAKALGFTTAPK
ncbi:MAG: glycoside hydrolase family 5 protein [Planctomycetota bacterium]